MLLQHLDATLNISYSILCTMIFHHGLHANLRALLLLKDGKGTGLRDGEGRGCGSLGPWMSGERWVWPVFLSVEGLLVGCGGKLAVGGLPTDSSSAKGSKAISVRTSTEARVVFVSRSYVFVSVCLLPFAFSFVCDIPNLIAPCCTGRNRFVGHHVVRFDGRYGSSHVARNCGR